VYLSSRTVQVFDKTGKKIQDIQAPEAPANMCFGGKDMKTLFITARTGLYAIKMQVKGAGPQ
jgi:gluconolactonase